MKFNSLLAYSSRIFSKLKPRKKIIKILAVKFLDVLTPKSDKIFLFVFKPKFGYRDNCRSMAEFLAKQGKRVIVYYEGELSEITKKVFQEFNIDFYNKMSPKNVFYILSAGTIFTTHSIRDVYITRRDRNRRIINLWHGVPLKQVELAAHNQSKKKKKLIMKTVKLYDEMIASSKVDRLAISSCFGINPEKVKVTGLPRYDIFKTASQDLPRDLKHCEAKIIKKIKDKRLVLYAPTFREKVENSAFVPSGIEFIEKLNNLCIKNGLILGIRPHISDPIAQYLDANLFNIFDSKTFSETNLLLKYTSCLITDYSSIWVDYLLLDRPILGFAEDFQSYLNDERGFLYNYHDVFPGKFIDESQILFDEIRSLVSNNAWTKSYPLQKKIFHVDQLGTNTINAAQALNLIEY